jgi:hypothetical protein
MEDHEGEEDSEEGSGTGAKKKDKKLVFLSRTVLEKVKNKPMTTGTQIANEILDLYRQFCEVLII